MEARVVNNLSPAAAHDGAVRCLVAIELSKKSWVVAVNTPLSDKISLYKLKLHAFTIIAVLGLRSGLQRLSGLAAKSNIVQ